MNPKRIFIFLIICCNSIVSSGQENHIDKFLCKKLKIKSIKIHVYKYDGKEKSGKGVLLFHWIYNSSGLLIDNYLFDDKIGEIRTSYKYDDKDSLKEEIDYIANEPYSTYFAFQYESGKLVKKYKGNEFWEFKYDNSGNLIEEDLFYIFPNSTEITSKDLNYYNEKRQKIKMIRQGRGNAEFFSSGYEYDETGNLIRQYRIKNGDTTHVFNRSYDSNHNVITYEFADYKTGKVLTWTKTAFDQNGLIVSLLNGSSHDPKIEYREYSYEYHE